MEASWAKRAVEGARERLRPVGALEELEACDLIIEAAPERLELKGELLRELAGHTGAVLATNTSSLPVTAVGAASGSPERVVGMHFFNPPPVMRLVEVVAGVDTSPESVAVARAAAEAMGRRVVEVADGIGFLVNRSTARSRLEALRIVHEGLPTPSRSTASAGSAVASGMGPFELMDLVARHVGLEIAGSFFEQKLQRAAVAPVAAERRKVDAGHLGRKAGAAGTSTPTGGRAARGARAGARRRRGPRHRGRAAGRDRAGAARAGRGLARRGARRRGRRGAVHRDRRGRRRIRARCRARRACSCAPRARSPRRSSGAGGRLLRGPAAARRRPAGADPRRRLVRCDGRRRGALRADARAARRVGRRRAGARPRRGSSRRS